MTRYAAFSTLLSMAVLLGAQAAPGCVSAAPDARASADATGAVNLLGPLAEDASRIGDVRLRTHVVAEVAGLLWPRDPARARSLFERSYALVDELRAPRNNDRDGYETDNRMQLRGELLEVARRHDPALAAGLLEQLVESSPAHAALAAEAKSWGQGDVARLLELADVLSRNDPPVAAAIVRRLLEIDPYEIRIVHVLERMRDADPALTRGLAVELVGRLGVSYAPPSLLALDADGALVFGKRDGALGDWLSSPKGDADAAPAPDPELARVYLEAFARQSDQAVAQFEAKPETLALTGRSGATPAASRAGGEFVEETLGLFKILTSHDAEFERFDPERLAGQRALAERVERLIARAGHGNEIAFAVAAQHGNARERLTRLVALEPKTPAPRLPDLYALIVSAAVAAGDYATAKLYAAKAQGESLEDQFEEIGRAGPGAAPAPAPRNRTMDLVLAHAGRAAAREGRFDDARRTLGEIADAPTRDAAYVAVGSELAARGDRDRALELVDLVRRPSTSADAAAALAAALARMDAERGFAALRDAVEAANRAPSADASARWPLATALPDAFEALAGRDLARVLGLAKGLRDPNASVVCRLAIAKGALA